MQSFPYHNFNSTFTGGKMKFHILFAICAVSALVFFGCAKKQAAGKTEIAHTESAETVSAVQSGRGKWRVRFLKNTVNRTRFSRRATQSSRPLPGRAGIFRFSRAPTMARHGKGSNCRSTRKGTRPRVFCRCPWTETTAMWKSARNCATRARRVMRKSISPRRMAARRGFCGTISGRCSSYNECEFCAMV